AEELERTRRMLADAETAADVDISKATIVNRLYYACFHAAQAALYARGYNPGSHGRVQTLFGRELVQSGEIPRDLGRFLHDMHTYRNRVDYGSGGVDRATDALLQETARFLDTVEALID
ncbi:MAG: HEPN domain-containing protein, partial [Halodesulfurarchaeum sp.]